MWRDWGPFYSRTEGPDGSMRVRALGPVWERRSRADTPAALIAARPFYAREVMADRWILEDWLWPVGRASRLDRDYTWRVLSGYYHDTDTSLPLGSYHFCILPFYFQGRNSSGEPYMALFPLGGRIDEFLLRERIDFILFPLWARTKIHDLRTLHLLYPVYSKTDHHNVQCRRFWPFYGYLRHSGRYSKTFIAWPFWNRIEWEYPRSRGYGYILLPFYGRQNLTTESTRMFLPPLFRVTQGMQMNRVHCPWPFLQYERGRVNRLYLWPVWGYRNEPGRRYDFALWPLFSRIAQDRGSTMLYAHRFHPFIYHDVIEHRGPGDREGPPAARRFECWPIASWDRVDDAREFRMPDLWPGRDPVPVARSWAPLWSIVHFRAQGDRSDFELLWGLVRRQVCGDVAARTSLFPIVEWSRDQNAGVTAHSWSVLKGLVGYERKGDEGRVRLLYFIAF